MLRHIFVTAILFTLLIPIPGLCQNLSGKVVSVADGDTVTVLTQGQRQIKIRLYGIDTPESGQAFGNKAKQFTSSLVYGKQVKITAYDIDKYGRTVGVVLVDGVNVNEEIVRNGYAWQYRKYCKESFCSGWIQLENAARQSRIGLWYDNDPTPPWEWRKGKTGAVSNQTATTEGNYHGNYHGNVKSKVFHGSGCQHYDCKNCVKRFDSIHDAIGAGYRPHKQCVR